MLFYTKLGEVLSLALEYIAYTTCLVLFVVLPCVLIVHLIAYGVWKWICG